MIGVGSPALSGSRTPGMASMRASRAVASDQWVGEAWVSARITDDGSRL